MAQQRTPRRSKFGNRRTEHTSPVVGRRVYASALEARYAAQLDARVAAGEIALWLPQVSIPVPHTGQRLVVDFMVIHHDGTFELADTKGAPPTRDWLRKRNALAAAGLTVTIVEQR